MTTTAEIVPRVTVSDSGLEVRRRGGIGGSLQLGAAGLWLSTCVLLPLAAIVWQSTDKGPQAFWAAITAEPAVESLRVTLIMSATVAVVNGAFGLLVAWVLAFDDFPGRRLVNTLVDMPFALPTIVVSLVMLALYGPNSPLDVHLQHTRWGVGIALLFVTLPFVVRSVQPVLLEMDPAAEEAAACLGASGPTIFLRIVVPAVMPALLSGIGLAFARAIGEYGSVVLIGGAIQGRTELASQWIRQLIENHDRTGAAAVSVVLLTISFLLLFLVGTFGARASRREERDT